MNIKQQRNSTSLISLIRTRETRCL